MLQLNHLTRRRFLAVVSLGAGVSAAGAVLGQHRIIGLLASVRSRLYGALDPALKDAPTGLLGEGTVQTLLATTEGLVGTEVESSHYEAFFRWRAENLRGYRVLYEQCELVLDHAAKEAGKADFVSVDREARREILQGMASRTYALVGDRDAIRFEKSLLSKLSFGS